jgi:Ulp1 family protease
LVNVKYPRQLDSYNCGVYVLKYAEYVANVIANKRRSLEECDYIEFSITNDDLNQYRMDIIAKFEAITSKF